MAAPKAPADKWDRSRWYPIGGRQLPSVTTFLDIIAKPALGPWYAKVERQAFETAMLEIASRYPTISADHLLELVIETVKGVKAADKEKEKAAAIGTAAHAKIEWHTRRLLGEDAGPEPVIPDAALLAVMAWEDWAKEVDFTPLCAERVVYCLDCGYAGTADWIAKVRGAVTLGDYKTGKAIWPEAFLQNRAYRHAAKRSLGIETEAGLILRLPKTYEDPAFEALAVPETAMASVLAALELWKWQRVASGRRLEPAAGRLRPPVA